MRVLLKAPLSRYSGWGQDGIGLATAMLRAGLDVRLSPVEAVPPLPGQVLKLLGRSLTPPFDLFLAHVAAQLAPLTTREHVNSRVRVLWSMWEWTTFANHPMIDQIRDGLSSYDAVIAYDAVSAHAFRKLPAACPVLQVQGGFDPRPWHYVERSWSPPIRFLLAGHLTERKNPLAALRAFRELLEEHGPDRFNAELHFKMIDRQNAFVDRMSGRRPAAADERLVPTMAEFAGVAMQTPQVYVYTGSWPRAALHDLYARMHCVLAPSRGEAKNLVCLEFLSTGGTVIATEFGGHAAWLDTAYAYPLRYTLRAASWPVPTTAASEADADVNHLKELMWHVYSDPDEARRKGERGAAVVPQRFSWDAALQRLGQALAEIGITLPTAMRVDT